MRRRRGDGEGAEAGRISGRMETVMVDLMDSWRGEKEGEARPELDECVYCMQL